MYVATYFSRERDDIELLRDNVTQRRAGMHMSDSATSPVGSVDHLSPPSTSSRLSDSEPDPSDLGDGEDVGSGGGGSSGGIVSGGPLLPPSRHGRGGGLERSVRSDGASVSSMGSSSRYFYIDYFFKGLQS